MKIRMLRRNRRGAVAVSLEERNEKPNLIADFVESYSHVNRVRQEINLSVPGSIGIPAEARRIGALH